LFMGLHVMSSFFLSERKVFYYFLRTSLSMHVLQVCTLSSFDGSDFYVPSLMSFFSSFYSYIPFSMSHLRILLIFTKSFSL